MKTKLLTAFGICAIGALLHFSGGLKNLSTSLITPSNMIVMKTSLGDIKIKLYTEKVPNITNNFLELTKSGKYDDTIFHRVIDGFMIQAGDYENSNGTGGDTYDGKVLKDEFSEGLSHVRGTLSMANRGPNTNGSQFFIVHQDAVFLDGRHAIFGQVTEGMDVVDKIATAKKDGRDAPLEKITINNIILQ